MNALPAPVRVTRRSLSGVYGSIAVPDAGRGLPGIVKARRWLSFIGPGFLVAAGYMDPGNWATSLAAGSQFGFDLLVVILIANALAMAFQVASVRLGIGGGMDLAQACRARCPPVVNLLLWLMCEIAIVACNLAEVIGMAVGLNLLFGIPLIAGVFITLVDVMLLLALQRWSFRILEVLIGLLILVVGVCFALQLGWLGPHWPAVLAGFLPKAEIVLRPDMLYLAVGIVGATVMPHNLYLQSAVVQTRRIAPTTMAQTSAIRSASWDTIGALGLALLINAAIMILAAGAFHRPGMTAVTELDQAYALLAPLLGVGIAGTVFGIALIASGLSASITGTLAGQVVMEGFLDLRMSRAARALLTRGFALIPAVLIIAQQGSAGVGHLLILSQVILSLQLPFALLPLLWFTTRRKLLGTLAFGPRASVALWAGAAVVVALNAAMLLRMAQ